MPEIALSDYLAHLLSEVSRARDMADRYSKEIAIAYAKDDVLRHFSVPRFKLAKLDLTMPVLVSTASMASIGKLNLEREDLRKLSFAAIEAIGLAAETARPIGRKRKPFEELIAPSLDDLHASLLASPAKFEGVVREKFPAMAIRAIAVMGYADEVASLSPCKEAIERELAALVKRVSASVTVSQPTLEKLLINPETNAIREGSSTASVFTIKAELVEEGLIVKTVRDERTGVESSVVEFE